MIPELSPVPCYVVRIMLDSRVRLYHCEGSLSTHLQLVRSLFFKLCDQITSGFDF